MSHAEGADPVSLIRGPVLANPYRCRKCRAIDMYPASITAGGAACNQCGAQIHSNDIVSKAPLSSRILAAVADLALLTPPIVVLFLLPAWISIGPAPKDDNGDLTRAAVIWITATLLGADFMLIFVYLAIGNARGKTVGMHFAGLRVVRFDTGDALGAFRSFARTIAQLVTIVTLGVGYLPAFFDHYGRTLHDRMAGSVVIEG